MASPDLVNLSGLMDDAKCFAFVRQHRWPEGVCCPGCSSFAVIRDGCDHTQPHRQRCRCKACAGRFDDTMEGFWSLLRSWLRPHRGISQDKLPLHLGFFQVVHNARRRGKALLGALVAVLVT